MYTVFDNCKTGIERYIELFTSACDKELRNHQVYFIQNTNSIFPRIEVENNCVKALFPLPENILLKISTYWRRKYFKVIIEILTPYFTGFSEIFFHCHDLFLLDLAEEFKFQSKGKIITQMHCIPWKGYLMYNESLFNKLNQLYMNEEYGLFKKMEDSTIKYQIADQIICLSEAAREYLVNIHQVNDGKIKIIHNGINVKKNIVDYRRKKDPIEILYVGKITRDKGIYELLDALRIVNDKGYDFKVIIAGAISNKSRQEINSDYKKLNINILGQISYAELQKLYKTCTIGIIPSLHEQCSYVALEMAMHGMPMIVSKIDALAEMFKHEETILYTPLVFDPDTGLNIDKDKFVKNIIYLINNENLRKKMSRNVQKLCIEKFNIDQMMDKTVTIYKSLCL